MDTNIIAKDQESDFLAENMQCLGLLGVRHFTKITHHSKPSTLLECFHGALEMINET